MIPYDHDHIATNGVTLHVVLAGPPEGEPVILLHGFPDFWYGWRSQIDFLAEKGFRVIVPDQRGYNLSDKPREITAYRIGTLTRDITELADALGYERFNLVGHDWGGGVAWWLVTMFPERLIKLAILNAPYPTEMNRAFQQRNLAQLRKSWYMFFFQIPRLPEAMMGANNARGLADAMRRSARPGTFTDEDMEQYRRAWTQPGALTAMVNWYRAISRSSIRRESGGKVGRAPTRITVPTLLIWGEQDVALGKELAQPSIDRCEDGRLVFLPEAGHWVQHEEPARVNSLLGEFFGS